MFDLVLDVQIDSKFESFWIQSKVKYYRALSNKIISIK